MGLSTLSFDEAEALFADHQRANEVLPEQSPCQAVGERASATAWLNGSELEFCRLLEKLPAGAYTCDPDGLINYYNQRAVELWGRAPKLNDPEDRFCGSFKLFSADGSPICHDQCWMALALRTGTEYNGHEIVIERPDGYRLTALAHANPIRDNSGTLLGAVNVLVDISDRKRSEEALREADRQKDEFLAVLAHELRNPLAPILNAAQVLQARETDDPIIQRQRAVIQRQARQMARLLDDLLDVSRITRGKIDLHRQTVDLAAVVDQAVESSRPMVEQRHQTLCVTLPSRSLYVYADATRLHQVIGNLLNNAGKYTPLGGKIHLILGGEGDAAVLRVVDTGVGIAPEFLPRIFDLFSQGDLSPSRSESGLGIGLTMVKRLVELHGGSVEAHSEGAGRGTEFVVRLPLATAPAVASAGDTRNSGRPAGTSGSRVLIVDDNGDAAETLADVARLWGHEVQTAPDGASALRLLREFRPQIVLLDISMPGMDGYEVARRVRSCPELGPVSLIALTGHGQEQDRRRSLEAGFDHHLIKPVDPDALCFLLAGSA
jgi:signal transduction histidine kinase/CheY-like chemotaxis protein